MVINIERKYTPLLFPAMPYSRYGQVVFLSLALLSNQWTWSTCGQQLMMASENQAGSQDQVDQNGEDTLMDTPFLDMTTLATR